MRRSVLHSMALFLRLVRAFCEREREALLELFGRILSSGLWPVYLRYPTFAFCKIVQV